MNNYITIDGGTTNTRISLSVDGKTVDCVKLNIGAKAGIVDKNALVAAIRGNISEMLKNNNLTTADIHRILASGMITSEFGLCKLDHITAPAGIEELNSSMHETVLENISEIPFVFIRGVKLNADSLQNADMMRGEETELIGLMESASEEGMYVLPGSHSKLIHVDKSGKIVNFTTMLTGEMIAALSGNTILKDAVDLTVSETDEDYLIKGYDYSSENGINEALFKVRILKNMFNCNPVQIYSFFMGIVLCDEIKKITKSDIDKIIIGGRSQIKNDTAILLKHASDKNITVIDDNAVSDCVTKGMIKIFEYKDMCNL